MSPITDTAVVVAAPGVDVWIDTGDVNTVEEFDEGSGEFPVALGFSTKMWGDPIYFIEECVTEAPL